MTEPQQGASSVALVRLLQLVSPTLPVGAYAYSQGMEHAVEARWVHDRDSAQEWIQGVLQHSLCTLELPVLQRLYAAWSCHNTDQLQYWSRFICASRETRELRAEDRQMGIALCRLLQDLHVEAAESWLLHGDVNWVLMFSLAAVEWGIPLSAASEGFLWAWCENQVAAAIKLVPLGQTDGQRILQHCAACIPALTQAATMREDDAIGQLAPALAIGSALHEQQYSRMFRS